jgi:hypothetical protein
MARAAGIPLVSASVQARPFNSVKHAEQRLAQSLRYSGKAQDTTMCLQRIVLAITKGTQVTALSDEEGREATVLFMRYIESKSAAATWLATTERGTMLQQGQCADWNRLVGLCFLQFNNSAVESMSLQALNSRQQQRDEPLEAFLADIEKFASTVPLSLQTPALCNTVVSHLYGAALKGRIFSMLDMYRMSNNEPSFELVLQRIREVGLSSESQSSRLRDSSHGPNDRRPSPGPPSSVGRQSPAQSSARSSRPPRSKPAFTHPEVGQSWDSMSAGQREHLVAAVKQIHVQNNEKAQAGEARKRRDAADAPRRPRSVQRVAAEAFTCQTCGVRGHYTEYCTAPSDQKALPAPATSPGPTSAACKKCGGKGHSADVCPSK